MLFESQKNEIEEVFMRAGPSKNMTGWTEIRYEEIAGWNDRLLLTGAHYRQYPYWCGPYANEGNFKPRFMVYRTDVGVAAYICVLEARAVGIKFGLVFGGPVALGREQLTHQIIDDLLTFARCNGYIFIRFTNRDEKLTQQLLSLANSRQGESFPFYRDPPRSLVVTQSETDEATSSSFQNVARRNIRAAETAGYVISKSDSIEDYRKMWPMFERLARNKGFDLSNRTLDAWLGVIGAARGHGCSALYTASLDGVCVSAIHLLRYGETVEFMLGALDLELLGENPSPSALLHWTAMRDMYRSGCRYYNLGGPGDGVTNKVYAFKRKFRPELQTAPPPVTVVLNPFAFAIWDLVVIKGWLGLRRQFRRVRGKSRNFYHRTREKLLGAN